MAPKGKGKEIEKEVEVSPEHVRLPPDEEEDDPLGLPRGRTLDQFKLDLPKNQQLKEAKTWPTWSITAIGALMSYGWKRWDNLPLYLDQCSQLF